MSAKGYDRPGGAGPARTRDRRTPGFLRGKPFRYVQREVLYRLHRWPHRNLLVIAQPKSGSTWLWRMLLETPAYFRWSIRSVQRHTMKSPGFHDLDESEMRSPPAGYSVSKTHTSASAHNLAILEGLGRPFVVLQRDPRDLAVSWAHFVAARPENAFHVDVEGMGVRDRVGFYIDNLLDRTLEWALAWRAYGGTLALHTSYEALKSDTRGEMRRIVTHLGLELSDTRLERMIGAHTFDKTKARAGGDTFFRKGESGGWREHFDEDLLARFGGVAGDRLTRLGYGDACAQ
ncbi:MAG: sulfotransferase domain-containing protein [Planctomycetota bacterium]